MEQYKQFLINICDIENVSVKEIMELTGKSQSVVYSWLNFSKLDCFPSIESLGKILFRLGLSFDDFVNGRHPVYDSGQSARVYYRYIGGGYENRYIETDILDLPNVDEVLRIYIWDRTRLNDMVNDHLNGLDIDMERFDLLCKSLKPCVVSEVVSDIAECVFDLTAQTLSDYKWGVNYIKEIEADYEESSLDFDPPHHKIYFPKANYVILLAAENNIDLLAKYLQIADIADKRCILLCYMKICAQISNYDKKNRIIKMLIENKCEFCDKEDKTIAENYRELLRKVLQVR